MEDLGYGALTRTASYKYAMHSDGRVYRYAANATVDGTSTIGGFWDSFNYMILDASNSVEETSSSNTWESLSSTTDSYVTMYQYKYSGRQTLPTTVSKADTYYWLATRFQFYAEDDYSVYYGAINVSVNGYNSNAYPLCTCHDFTFEYSCGVRPVVYLNTDIHLSYDATNGYTLSY